MVVGVGYGDAAVVGVLLEATGKIANVPAGRFVALEDDVFYFVGGGIDGILGHAGAGFEDCDGVFHAVDVDDIAFEKDGIVGKVSGMEHGLTKMHGDVATIVVGAEEGGSVGIGVME